MVNDRTKHLVSGHQRIWIIDALEHRKDYDIDVALVDLTLKQEKEQIIALNNLYMAGTFDFEKLSVMLPKLGIEDCGFDEKDLGLIFPTWEAPMNAPTMEQMEDVKRTASELEKARLDARAAKAAANPEDEADRRQRIKLMREVLKKTETSRFVREGADSLDVEYFVIAQFNNLAARAQFLATLKLDPQEAFISGEMVMGLVTKALGKEKDR